MANELPDNYRIPNHTTSIVHFRVINCALAAIVSDTCRSHDLGRRHTISEVHKNGGGGGDDYKDDGACTNMLWIALTVWQHHATCICPVAHTSFTYVLSISKANRRQVTSQLVFRLQQYSAWIDGRNHKISQGWELLHSSVRTRSMMTSQGSNDDDKLCTRRHGKLHLWTSESTTHLTTNECLHNRHVWIPVYAMRTSNSK